MGEMKEGDVFGWLWQGAQELVGPQEDLFQKNLLNNNHLLQNEVKDVGVRLPRFNFRSAS